MRPDIQHARRVFPNAVAASVAAGYRNAVAVGVAILLDNKYSGRTASNAAIHRDAVGERLGAADRLASGRDADLGVCLLYTSDAADE